MKSFLKTKDFSVSQEEFELLYDSEKDFLATHPQPKNLDRYYQSESYISHTDAKQTFFERAYQLIKGTNLKRKLKLARKYASGEQRLLDVGSGTGDFLVAAKHGGWQVAGVEPNEKARIKSQQKGVKVNDDLFSLEEQYFQIITLWHVLEHLPYLDKSIAQIGKLLKNNGTLIVAVPNFKSWDAQHFGKYWAAYDVPRHLWHFSRTSIEHIFKEHGLVLVKTKPMWFDAFYVSILSEKYKNSKAAFLKGMLLGFWSNLRALSSKEYSSVIYILKNS